ncbi:hypothetical protein LXL04_033670 [Taraxacum kok-saghyz]
MPRGTDTSSITIGWAMTEIIRHPHVMEKVQAEVREAFKGKGKISESELQNLSYLQSVIKETLRLHPPIPLLLPRVCREQCKIGGYDIPVKMKVFVNGWACSTDPEYWEDADTFNPERFENASVDFMGTNYHFIPFGSGRRMCPGITFGMVSVELLLAQMLYYFDWKLPDRINPAVLPHLLTYKSHHSCRPPAYLHRISPILTPLYSLTSTGGHITGEKDPQTPSVNPTLDCCFNGGRLLQRRRRRPSFSNRPWQWSPPAATPSTTANDFSERPTERLNRELLPQIQPSHPPDDLISEGYGRNRAADGVLHMYSVLAPTCSASVEELDGCCIILETLGDFLMAVNFLIRSLSYYTASGVVMPSHTPVDLIPEISLQGGRFQSCLREIRARAQDVEDKKKGIKINKEDWQKLNRTTISPYFIAVIP